MFIVPSLHPAHILRNNAKLGGLVELSFDKANRIAYGNWRPKWVENEFILKPTADQVVTVLRSMAGRAVAYDVETDGRHPMHNDLRCIGFYDGKVGITVPLLYRDGSREDIPVIDKKGNIKMENRAVWRKYFSGEAETKVLNAIRALLGGGTELQVHDGGKSKTKDKKPTKKSPDLSARILYTQNGQYDRMVVRAQTGIDIKAGATGYTFDTIVAHHVMCPYLPHGLGLLAALYTDAPYYKATEKGDSWSSESDHELWLYCLRDVKATWLIAEMMQDNLEELRTARDRSLYPNVRAIHDHDTWQEDQCEKWKQSGIQLDKRALRYFRYHYTTVRDRALEAMRRLLEAQFTKGDVETRNEHFQALLDKLSAKVDKLGNEVWGDEEKEIDGGRRSADAFNPASLIELRFMLAGLGIPLSEVTATGQLSTAKEILTSARKELLQQKVPANDPRIAFLDYLFAWRESAKVVGTYLYPEVLHTGRVHPTFSVHVVPTGRLCIAEWTKVRTRQRGWVHVSDVAIGDEVWTHKNRWRPVLNIHRNGVREVVDLRLQNGKVLTATTDHRFFGRDGWITAGEIRERLEEVVSREGKPRSSGGVVQKPQLAYSRIHRRDAEGNARNGDSGAPLGAIRRGHQSPLEAALFSIENGHQESHEGEGGRSSSSVERALRGPEGVSHRALARETSLRTPRSDVGSAWPEGPSQDDGRASHRRHQNQQRLGQPRVGDEAWASTDSFPAGERFDWCDVEAVVPRGRVETVDLEVAEDHSFEVEGGVFSHNSSKGPNFQNQPAEIRGMYVARPGHVLISMDWDALEMRLGAFLSGDPRYIEVFKKYDTVLVGPDGKPVLDKKGKKVKAGPKPHHANMSVIFGLPATAEAADQNPGMYRAAKVFAYAVAYGAGEDTVYEQVREEMPDMSWTDFQLAFSNYKKAYAGLFAFMKKVVADATKKGYVESGLMGRRIFFFERGWDDSSPEATAMQNAPFQSGGADIVGQANRRIDERLLIPTQAKLLKGKAFADAYKALAKDGKVGNDNLEDVLAVGEEVCLQLAQIHDELLYEVPIRIADQWLKDLVKIAEEKPKRLTVDREGNYHWTEMDWNLPVDAKKSKRWKPVQARCMTPVTDDKGKPSKCRELVDVEVEEVVLKTGKGKTAGTKTVERWTGKCSHGHDVCIDVETGAIGAAA